MSSHLDLKEAIARRDLSEIAKLVNRPDVIRSWPDDDMKPLAYAAKYGDVATVEELLRHGIDVNETEQDGQTALLVAASSDREDTAKVLLDNGARADCVYMDRDDLDPLIIAAKLGSNRVLKLLIERGSSVSRSTKQGLTALMAASIQEDRPETIDMLIEAGADPNQKTIGEWSALDYALAYRRDQAAKRLQAYGAIAISETPYPVILRG